MHPSNVTYSTLILPDAIIMPASKLSLLAQALSIFTDFSFDLPTFYNSLLLLDLILFVLLSLFPVVCKRHAFRPYCKLRLVVSYLANPP